MKLNNRGNWTLIGLLVTLVVVIVGAALLMGKMPAGGPSTVTKKNGSVLDSKSQKKTVFGKAIDTGKATDCKERLNQIRLGILAYKTTGTDDRNPASFKDIGLSVGMDYFQCPMALKPYTYDPATGVVKCPVHTDF